MNNYTPTDQWHTYHWRFFTLLWTTQRALSTMLRLQLRLHTGGCNGDGAGSVSTFPFRQLNGRSTLGMGGGFTPSTTTEWRNNLKVDHSLCPFLHRCLKVPKRYDFRFNYVRRYANVLLPILYPPIGHLKPRSLHQGFHVNADSESTNTWFIHSATLERGPTDLNTKPRIIVIHLGLSLEWSLFFIIIS